MAVAISSARGDPTALTPPSSSHSDETPWGHSQQQSQQMHEKNGSVHPNPSHRHSVYQHSVNSSTALLKLGLDNGARKMLSLDNLHASRWDKAVDSGLSTSSNSESKMGKSDWSSYNQNGSSDNLKRPAPQRAELGFGADKWIHRDKLAKIESEELQAAGFYVPRPRAQSKQPRDRSARRDADAEEGQSRPKNETEPDTDEVSAEFWDLRTPEEIAEEGASAYFIPNESKGGSRIPVAKISPAPIPLDYLERELPAPRKATESPDGEAATTITYPGPRSRSTSTLVRDAGPRDSAVRDIAARDGAVRDSTPATPGRSRQRPTGDTSPKKSATSNRASATFKSTAGGRPKTRSNSNSHGGSTSTRPITRTGDALSNNRAPEGDPPWMFAGFKPDPRLPPEQQIIPTVARRLAQEKWEKEGKFGDLYDKDFRPLNDTFLVKMSGLGEIQTGDFNLDLILEPKEEQDGSHGQEQGCDQNKDQSPPQDETPSQAQTQAGEWPLKTELSKTSTSPTSPATRQGSSYSTMPKISDKPATGSTANSQTPTSRPTTSRQSKSRSEQKDQIKRVPSLSDEQEKKAGCGCCVVM